MLLLTAEVLKKNADIYTFWNIRRETLELLLKVSGAMSIKKTTKISRSVMKQAYMKE